MDAAVVLAASTVLFVAVAAWTATAVRTALGIEWGSLALVAVGTVAAVAVGAFWLDGRIGRYFAPADWLVVVAAPAVGVGLTGRRTTAVLATLGWTATFAIAYGLRLPFAIPLGRAATIGFLVEALVVAFVATPGLVLAAGLLAWTRRHATRNRTLLP